MSGHYTLSEVLWLLSMTRDEAEAYDIAPSPLGRISVGDGDMPGLAAGGASSDGPDLPVLVRWRDVRAAQERVQDALNGEIVRLRAQGLTEQQVGEAVGRSQQTVSRRFRAGVEEILAELGGVAAEDPGLARVPLCISCGLRPRARRKAVTRKARGGRVVVRAERDSSLCAVCTREADRHLLIGPNDRQAA